jgi:hypothetical protein
VSGRTTRATGTIESPQKKSSREDDMVVWPERPTPNATVIQLLVEKSLGEQDPVESLRSLQHDQRFQYGVGQRLILTSLVKAERRAFQELESTDKLPQSLLACISHLGELIKVPLTDELCMTWALLMADELNYLSRQEVLSPDHQDIGLHACAILERLMDWWSRPDASEIPHSAVQAIVQAMEQLVCSPAIADLVRTERSLDGAVFLAGVIHLAASLGDPVVVEHIIDLLPSMFAVCQELCPAEFCREVTDSLPEEHDHPTYAESDTSALIDEPDVGDKGKIIDADSTEAALLERELAEANQQDAVINAWEDAYLLNLLVVNLLSEGAHRAHILVDILRSCPCNAKVWTPTLDALIGISHEIFQKLLPELLTRSMAEPLGGVTVLQIADFKQRTRNEDAEDPFPALVAALKQLPRAGRNRLLKDCKDLLLDQTDLFSEPEVTKRALKMLHAELKKPSC